jgi:hypothetical protein
MSAGNRKGEAVPNSDIQIFISYARDDDKPAPDLPETKGFVTFLREMLAYEFSKLGASRPKIWRDTNRIAQGDQFEQMIEEAVAQSSILLVVLSQVWMARDFCQRELKSFAERWREEGPEGIRSRIVVVGKRYVDPDKRPSLLQHQQGFEFYSMNDPDDVGFELEFYSRGRIRDPRFETRMEQLAAYLWRKAERFAGGKAEPPQPAQPASLPPAASMDVAPQPKPASANGRTIYLAKPADDMRENYSRIGKELEGRGYVVVPNVESELPRDSSALAYIDTALAAAELSVHLVGEKPGFAPDDVKLERIVKLQLTRAAARVPAAADTSGKAQQSFRRIIWAPRLLESNNEPSDALVERDPLAVLAQFDRQLPTDKIEGDSLSKFVDFLTQHLLLIAPPIVMPDPIQADTRLYLCHSEQDAEYVGDLAEALQQRQIEIVYPAFEGSERELQSFHRQQLALCDAVALCWASAPEVWVRAHASELRDPHGLGRTKPFAYRSVVTGPPPGTRKKVKGLFPPREIDFVVDLIDKGRPSPEMLDQLVPGDPHSAS